MFEVKFLFKMMPWMVLVWCEFTIVKSIDFLAGIAGSLNPVNLVRTKKSPQANPVFLNF